MIRNEEAQKSWEKKEIAIVVIF